MSHQGHIVAGRYRLLFQLGRGGMGTVWRAEHAEIGSPVALKLIDPEIASSPEALARFRREAKAAASLSSPHVVQIFDFGLDDDTPYIAMELLVGESLAQCLTRFGKLAPIDVVHVITQAARGVVRAHEVGIVHRDLKPDNIYLVRNEDEVITKVLDFGIAKEMSPNRLETQAPSTRTGTVMGTPFYMSPEQALGTKTVDSRTDIWALGVIAYESLLGQRPFESEAFGELVVKITSLPMPVPSEHGDVPGGFDDWFAKACHRDPKERFRSARDLASALREVVAAGSRDTAPTPKLVRSLPTISTNTTLAAHAPTGGAVSLTPGLPGRRKSRSKTILLGSGLGALVAAVAIVGAIALHGVRLSPTASKSDPVQGTRSSSTLLEAPSAVVSPPASASASVAPSPAVEPPVQVKRPVPPPKESATASASPPNPAPPKPPGTGMGTDYGF